MTSPNHALFIDIETTGKENPVAVEIAHVSAIDGSRFLSRYNPGKPIGYGAMAVHHITEAMVDGCPPASDFSLPADCRYIIGHNVDFDWEVIGKPEVKRICTLALAQHYLPNLDSHTLGALVYFYHPEAATDMLQHAHSALDDTLNCLTIFHDLAEQFGFEGKTWEEIWKLSEDARIPTHWTFGKHKGEPIGCDWGYASWYINQPNPDPYIVEAIRQAFNLKK